MHNILGFSISRLLVLAAFYRSVVWAEKFDDHTNN